MNTPSKHRMPSWQAADRKFFERHPDRQCRLRRCGKEEMASWDTPPPDLPEGKVWAVVVTQVAPGARIRQLYQLDRKASVYCHMWDDFYCSLSLHQGWLSCPPDVAMVMTDRRVQ